MWPTHTTWLVVTVCRRCQYQFRSVPHVVRRLPSKKSDSPMEPIKIGSGDKMDLATDDETGFVSPPSAADVLKFAGLDSVRACGYDCRCLAARDG